MIRRRHLIAYDIADDRRLRQVLKVMESHGVRLQYSVFLCDLTKEELLRWRTAVMAIVVPREDSVVVIDLGRVERAAPIETIGKPRQLPRPPGAIV